MALGNLKIETLFFLLLPFALPAQQAADYYFINLTSQDGLSQNSVTQIMQDHQGMIWIATQTGLDKYVGKMIKPVSGFQKSLSETITYLYDWDEEHILVSTTANAYLIHKWHFNRVTKLSEEYANIKYISKIDKATFLIFSKNKIGLVKGQAKPKKQNSSIRVDGEIYQVVQARDKSYYIATSKGLLVYRHDKDKSPQAIPVFNNTPVYALAFNADSSALYFGADQMRLLTYNLKSNAVTSNFNLPPNSSGPISCLLLNGQTLLAGTREAGLLIYDLEGEANGRKSPARHLHPDTLFHSRDYFSSRNVNCLLRSADGVVWAGTDVGGLNTWPSGRQVFRSFYSTRRSTPFPNVSTGSDVRSLFLDTSRNRMLVGLKNHGIAIVGLADKRVIGTIQPANKAEGGKSVYAQKLLDDRLYIGTEDGIFITQLKTITDKGTYQRVSSKTGPVLKGETVSIMHYHPGRQTWLIGKRGGEKIRVYDRVFDAVVEIPLKKENEILSFIQTLGKNTLVGTSKGVYRVDYAGNKLEPMFKGVKDTVHYTCAWQSGDTLWLGTDRKGLYVFSLSKQDSIDHYGPHNGLPDEVIYDIQRDRFGNFWLSTNHGLYQLQQTIDDFNHYGIRNGLSVYEFNSGATTAIDRNTLFFGGINGVHYFEPIGEISDTSAAFKILVQCSYASADSVYIFDFNDGPPKKPLVLPFIIGYLEVDPLLGHYQDPENNRYRVKFNGIEVDARIDGRYIIPESWIWPWFLKRNTITVESRTGDGDFIAGEISVKRRVFTGANKWIIPVIAFLAGFAFFLFLRGRRISRRYSLVQEKINLISRLDTVEEIGTTAVKHFVEDLKYDYGMIALIDFDKKIIQIKYANDPKRTAAEIALWKELSQYPLDDDDILAQVATIGELVAVIGNDWISSDRIRKTDKLFNKEVAGRFKHVELARVFLPIIHRGKTGIEEGTYREEDTVLGVVEVGFRMNTINKYFAGINNPVLSPAYKSFNILKFIQSQRIRLQLYIDNLAQPYYKAFLKQMRQNLYEFIEDLEKESDKQGGDHEEFLSYTLAQLVGRIGADYGDISLTTFNSVHINFRSSNYLYGYEREAAKKHSEKVSAKNAGKEGIINYVSKSRKYYYTGNAKEDPKYIEFIPDANSELAMPMLIKESYLVGVVNLMSKKRDFFNQALAQVYQRGVNRLGEIYMQKKQYISLQKISTPFDTFSMSEELLYKNMVEALKEYFRSDYISVWVRTSPEKKEFFLSETATLPDFYKLYEKIGFLKADINREYNEETNTALVELVQPGQNKKKDSRILPFCQEYDLKNYIVLKIIIDDKYQAFINVFSKREVYEEEITGYSRILLNEVSKKVALASWNLRLSNSIDTVARSLIKRETQDPLEKIVEQAYWLSPSADSVVLFPYQKGKTIVMQDAIVGGRDLPKENPDKPAKFANFIVNNKSYFITNENDYIALAELAAKDRPAHDNFWSKRNLKSMAAIRLDYEDDPVGVMFFNYTEQKNFSEDNTRQFIEAFANFAKIALTNEDYIRRIQAEREKLNEEYEMLSKKQQELRKERDEQQKEKENIQFEYEKVFQKMEEMIPRATKASYYMIMQGINHDIRNFLVQMGSMLRKLENDNSIAKYRDKFSKSIKDINDNVENIENLLDLFGYKKDTKDVLFNVNEVIDKVVSFYKRKDELIQIEYYTGSSELNLFGSKEEFSMVMYNILNNAFQAIQLKGEDEKGEIVIRANIDKEKHIHVWIKDDGVGIDKDLKEKIFEFGFTTKEKDGLGIGLYFVKEVIYNTFRGEVNVDSYKGKGTTFHITIPQN
jgi:signal transduction histidine kinase/ligand-binding sensor domain-containing protein